MCILSSLQFPLDKELNLPPLTTSKIQCMLVDNKCVENDSGVCFNEESSLKNLVLPFASTSLTVVPVHSATVLCEGCDVKTVIEIVFDISELNLNYLPGDTIGILPKNDSKEVVDVLTRLGLVGDDEYKVDFSSPKYRQLLAHIPSVFTVKYLFESCLDLRAVVKKAFLRSLAEHTSDPTEKRRIIELCCKEGTKEYNECILKPKSSIIDILRVFSSCSPPLSLLIEHIPRLQPRPYSIASSPLEDLEKLRIVFNVVNDSRNRRGVCSGWLCDITRPFHDLSYKLSHVELSDNLKTTPVKVPIYLRKPSNFRIPENSSVPLIMIGSGTGIAPFIGFIEHRRKQLTKHNESKVENWIIFGCRHRNKDELFKNMFAAMEKEKLVYYHAAYSRDNEDTYLKYVQDIMKLKENDLVDLILMSEAIVFICGNGLAMTNDVMETLVHMIARVKGVSEEEAKEISCSLVKNGQIVKELWS